MILRLAMLIILSVLLTGSASEHRSPLGPCRVTPELRAGALAMARAGAEGKLGTYLSLHAALDPAFERACDWTPDFTLQSVTGDFGALYSLNRLVDIDQRSAALLDHYANLPDRRDLRAVLRAYRVFVAIERRDAHATLERVAAYDRELSGARDPTAVASRMAQIRRCIEEGDIAMRCRQGESTSLYGQFAFTRDANGASASQGQCPTDTDALPVAYLLPDGPLRLVAEPGKALNAACQRERRIAALAGDWWLAVTSGDSRSHSYSKRLLAELDAWALEIDAFDSDNPISRFQPRALAFFVRHSMRRMRNYGKIALSTEEDNAQADERNAIQPFFDAAMPAILRGDSGFLRVDNIGLAGFVAGRATWLREQQGEAVWRLLAASFGSSRASQGRSLAEVRAGLADDELLITAIHPIDGTGVILAAARTGWPWIQELDTGSAVQASQLGAMLSDAVATEPSAGSGFPLAAARKLYYQYICPAELVDAFRSLLISYNKAGKAVQVDPPPPQRHKLLFVPDSVMERIPLSLLARPVGGCLGAGGFDDPYRESPVSALSAARWVGDDYSIRIMPFQATAPLTAGPAPSGYLGIGGAVPAPPLMARSDDPAVAQSDFSAALPPLKGAQAEFERIAAIESLEGSSILSGQRATEGRLREALSVTPQILHFATHGLDPADFPVIEEPLLALTRPAGRYTAADDGALTAHEISALSLHGTVVVLSACRTASPLRGFGKGIFSGLVQSFFDAGADQAIATYWPIDDAASAELVPDMIRLLAAGREPADAILEAQRAFRVESAKQHQGLWSHPYFWAAFVPVTPNLGRRISPAR